MSGNSTETTAIVTQGGAEELREIIKLATDHLGSAHSVRAYTTSLAQFLAWREERGRPAMSKALVTKYRRHLVESGLAASTVNLRLSAIKALATEAADNGLMESATAAAINRIKGVKRTGRQAGNWLTIEEAQAVLEAPDTTTLRGLRDRAILAVLLGAGLRRSEAAALEVHHLQERSGRPVIVDLVGKGNRTRTIPIAPWIERTIREWLDAAEVTDSRVFRAVNKAQRVQGDGVTAQAIMLVVQQYTPEGIAPHDLRRSFAHMAYEGGAALDQVSFSLGHASIQTTERYLGLALNLANGETPSDRIGIGL